MKQKIEIEVPDGKIAIWKNNKVVFKDIKPQLPKTWKEFCANKNKIPGEAWIDWDSSINYVMGDKPCKMDTLEDKNLLPNAEAAKAHLALMQLHQLRDCYRQGWKPDWYDETSKFYISRWHNEVYSVFISYYVPHFLTFQTEKLAEEFLNNFRDLIEQVGDLLN